jgi:hypothetical protein
MPVQLFLILGLFAGRAAAFKFSFGRDETIAALNANANASHLD